MTNNNFFELIHHSDLLNSATMTLFIKRFDENVNISQILVLSKLEKEGPQKPTDIAHSLGYTSGAVTKLINNLLRNHYVERKAHPHDRRVFLISITENGQNLLIKAQEQGQKMNQEIYSVLNEEEVEQLLNIQNKLFNHVKKLNEND
ncbi:MarR family transcriptional regulator [Staphylococcus sp. EZ-P03]|uniref:MarR family winged helix-turn-helix transcriptional regulator n=1 Tax=Staphylococcus sp. EZ-P03 TaxID=2282739 RepID=UPI000DF7EA7A|nr:MarR family transcriptional regulator [Staphylococcus sp. EZ-P03]